MKARGSLVKSIDQFVKDVHSEGYEKWKDSLPKSSIDIISSASTSDWYPVQEGIIIPTEAFCDMFYPLNKTQGAWKCGRYAAEIALTGIYKVFILVSKPSFILKRASRVFSTFFNPADLHVIESSNTHTIIRSNELPAKNELLECRIAGWMEKALEICGSTNISVEITKSIAKGDPLFEVSIKWT